MITVHCNEKDALRSVEHVYREAATMFPAGEDLLEHSGDLARKKQLVSQERAAAKKPLSSPTLWVQQGRNSPPLHRLLQARTWSIQCWT
jgi:hypothetical protein